MNYAQALVIQLYKIDDAHSSTKQYFSRSLVKLKSLLC